MKTNRMGGSGLRVSEVCLGTMTFGNQADQDTSFAIMDVADAHGVTFFDTADVYPLGGDLSSVGRTEEIVGAWLQARGARERIVLATKCRGTMGPNSNDAGLSRKHIISACDASLHRLQTDYIDLYQVHWPDADVEIEETLRALDDLVRDGKVRYVGCSNYPAHLLSDALWTSKMHGLARFECDQPRYNILFRMIEDEILPLCRQHGVGVIAYNPLAGGMLTGRYRDRAASSEVEQGSRFALTGASALYRQRYWNDAVFETVKSLGDFVSGRGKSLTHVALAWVLVQEGVTSAIVGASKPAQLVDSLAGVDLMLDDEEREACDGAWHSLPRDPNRATALR